MPTLRFTSALKRFFPDLEELQLSQSRLEDILDELEKTHPGILNYLLDDQKQLRKHVNIFIDGDILSHRDHLNQEVAISSEIFIVQALSGG